MTRTQDNNEHKNALAKQSALSEVIFQHDLAATHVAYDSHGHLLLIGPEDLVRLAACQLKEMASLTLLISEPVQAADQSGLEEALEKTQALPTFFSKLLSVGGYMGQFNVLVEVDGAPAELSQLALKRTSFDLILDLGSSAFLQSELLPAGYFHIAPNASHLAELLTELPNYLGTFEKPKYFSVNNDICAHSSRGQTGCTRCLDVCPADAIKSIKQLITIDPYLCHGAGGCTTACPTGAIHYMMPKPAYLIDYLSRLLNSYRLAGGQQPVFLFHDHQEGKSAISAWADKLPSNIIPIELEELAAAGMEIWLGALAMGASHLVLLDTAQIPESMKQLLNEQVQLAHTILHGLQQDTRRLTLISPDDLDTLTELNEVLSYYQDSPAYPLTPQTAKRDTLFAAIDFLAKHVESPSDTIAMPANAPFGEVMLDTDRCTLCMSCVAVCPTSALTDGGDKPAINFTEQSCVQCSLCKNSCPENAISLQPRLLLTEQRNTQQILLSEEPFNCISCGKGFAPERTVNKMIEKLSEHRFFQGEALNRLKMCEDCRVRDIFSDLSSHPEKQLEL